MNQTQRGGEESKCSPTTKGTDIITCSCTGVGAKIEIWISWKSGAQKQRISSTITLIDHPATLIHDEIYKTRQTKPELLKQVQMNIVH
jgi:ABC-type polar amino acid transport system ATPase subunit